MEFKTKPKIKPREEEKSIGLDDYFFERKLQEVYDATHVFGRSGGAGKFFKNFIKSLRKRHAVDTKNITSKKELRKKKTAALLIDAPMPTTNRFKRSSENKPTRTHDISPLTTARQFTKNVFKRFRTLKRTSMKQRIAAGTVLVVLLAIFIVPRSRVAPSVLGEQSEKTGTTLAGENGQGAVQGTRLPINQDPDFRVLLPEGKTEKDVGGFARSSPEGSAPAYTFTDVLSSAPIRVTQQQMPENFRSNPSAEVEKLALGFNAKEAIKDPEIEFFIGNSTKGIQSIISYKKDLLIFIQSDKVLDKAVIGQYLKDLQ